MVVIVVAVELVVAVVLVLIAIVLGVMSVVIAAVKVFIYRESLTRNHYLTSDTSPRRALKSRQDNSSSS